MTWFVTTLAVVLIVITTAAVLGRVDGSLAEPTSSLAHEPLPDAPLTTTDLDELRFDTALRGYRMGQVDRVVDRLRLEITTLEQEVAVLRAPASGDEQPSAGDGTAEAAPSTYSRPDDRQDPRPDQGDQQPDQRDPQPARRTDAHQEETA